MMEIAVMILIFAVIYILLTVIDVLPAPCQHRWELIESKHITRSTRTADVWVVGQRCKRCGKTRVRHYDI